MTLTATAVQAQCTVSDIKMTKQFPAGNLSRSSDLLTNNAIIQFALGDCPIADPPLRFCVDVWDTGNPNVLPSGIQYTGTGGWVPGIPPSLCTENFLADNGLGTNTAITGISLFIQFQDTTAGPHPPDRLILVMHNPMRYLKIPID